MPIKTLIETNNAHINGNSISIGKTVSDNGVNLCYYETLQMTPEDCVQIMASWDDIPGNEDDAINGTRQIRVNTVEPLNGGKWGLSITPGSFYFTETLRITGESTDRLMRLDSGHVQLKEYGTNTFPDWDLTFPIEELALASTDPYPNEVILRWEYSLARNQIQKKTQGTYSDPTMTIGYDESSVYGLLLETPEHIGKNTYKLRNTPIITTESITTKPRMVLYANGELINATKFDDDDSPEFRFTVVDSENGIVSTTRDLTKYEVYVQYIAPIADHKMHATFDGTHFCPINLNPVTNQTAISSIGKTISNTIDELRIHGVRVYIQPLRCVVTDKAGNVLKTFENTDVKDPLLWCYDDETSNAILDQYTKQLAAIYVKPSTAIGSLKVYDTRSRGGGIREEEIVTDYPDHVKYFDIEGVHMDGDVSMENGVVVVKIAQAIYNEHGEAKIREAIEKSIAGGIAYLIKII